MALFNMKLWMKGQPLIHKVVRLARTIVFPGAMFASLIYCPPDLPKEKK